MFSKLKWRVKISAAITITIVSTVCALYGVLLYFDHQVQTSFAAVRAEYQGRLAAIPPALQIARQAGTVSPQLIAEADAAYQQALQAPPVTTLLEDVAGFDRFKRLQGELTVAIFQLMGSCIVNPAVHEHPNVKALRAYYEGAYVGPLSSHSRYARAAARMNDWVNRYPTKFLARAMGFTPRPEFIRRLTP